MLLLLYQHTFFLVMYKVTETTDLQSIFIILSLKIVTLITECCFNNIDKYDN